VVGSPTTTSPSTSLGSTSYSGRTLAQEEREPAARSPTPELREPAASAGPFRADTTGLSTAQLPPPPVFRGDGVVNKPGPPGKPKPKLPPRLPPRDPSIETPTTPPPTYDDAVHSSAEPLLNQGAIDRLGRAGVSVPGLGIERTSPPHLPPRSNTTSAGRGESSSSPQQSQLSELQNRFAHMRTGSSESSSGGTTWAQKRAALETATNFKKDPSSVSASDLRDAASTANNFRERHGEQVAAGWKAANNLNQKYGIMDRVKSSSPNETSPEPPDSPASPEQAAHKKRPPPPPPPPKKHEWNGKTSEPPPIPLSSKPKPT